MLVTGVKVGEGEGVGNLKKKKKKKTCRLHHGPWTICDTKGYIFLSLIIFPLNVINKIKYDWAPSQLLSSLFAPFYS